MIKTMWFRYVIPVVLGSILSDIDGVTNTPLSTGARSDYTPSGMSDDMEYADESFLLEPLNASGALTMGTTIPEQVSGIEDVTHVYTAEGDPGSEETKVVQPKLLDHADRAMVYVKRVYNLIEKYNHMYVGKSQELGAILESYTAMLSSMLENKIRMKHLSFVRRYLTHVSECKSTLLEAEERRAALVNEASHIFNDVGEKHGTIKLDFERHYAHPSLVINNAVSSLVGIGEAYKRLVTLHGEVFKATDTIRLGLNRMRASTVYMFSYLLCLDVIFNEILPLRTVAVQDVAGIKGTGEVLAGYHSNIRNKRAAIKALLGNAQLSDSQRSSMNSIYEEVSRLYARGKMIRRSTYAFVTKSRKEAVLQLYKRISRVVEVWNKQYRRPLVMSGKLIEEYHKLKSMTRKIDNGQGNVHRNKQSLYTMSVRCEDLYQEARALANLSVYGSVDYGKVGNTPPMNKMDVTSGTSQGETIDIRTKMGIREDSSKAYQLSHDRGYEYVDSGNRGKSGTSSRYDTHYGTESSMDGIHDHTIIPNRGTKEDGNSTSLEGRSENDMHNEGYPDASGQPGLNVQDIDDEWNLRFGDESDRGGMNSLDSDDDLFPTGNTSRTRNVTEDGMESDLKGQSVPTSSIKYSKHRGAKGIVGYDSNTVLSDDTDATSEQLRRRSDKYKTGVERKFDEYHTEEEEEGMGDYLNIKRQKIDKDDNDGDDNGILNALVLLLNDLKGVNEGLVIYKDDIMGLKEQTDDGGAVNVAKLIITELHRICRIYSNTTETVIPQEDEQTATHPIPS